MNCELANEHIMKYFDRELNDIEISQLKQHLKSCKKCSLSFNELNGIMEVLEQDGLLEPPPGFEVEIMGKIKSINVERKKNIDRLLISIYSISSIVLLGMAMMLVGYFKEINFLEVLGELAVIYNAFVGIMQFMAAAQAGFVFNGVLILAFAILLMYLGIIIFMDINVGGVGNEGKK